MFIFFFSFLIVTAIIDHHLSLSPYLDISERETLERHLSSTQVELFLRFPSDTSRAFFSSLNVTVNLSTITGNYYSRGKHDQFKGH